MITCGIASIPSRVDCLKKTIDSIKDQVNLICVVLNGYTYTPEFLNDVDNLIYSYGDNSQGDAMKFQMAEYTSGYYMTLDDDLEAEQGYVAYLISKVNEYNGLVSLHGKHYTPPVTSFKQWDANYRCLDEVKGDHTVNLIGSGCCMFKTSRLKVKLSDFTLPNMADVFLSKLATEQGVPMMAVDHAKGRYLNYLYPKGSTIWQDTKDYSKHIEIMNTFIK